MFSLVVLSDPRVLSGCIAGAFGALFKEQPPGQMVVHRGDEVTLPCVTNEDVQCAWKLEAPRLSAKGFLTMNVSADSNSTVCGSNGSRIFTLTYIKSLYM